MSRKRLNAPEPSIWAASSRSARTCVSPAYTVIAPPNLGDGSPDDEGRDHAQPDHGVRGPVVIGEVAQAVEPGERGVQMLFSCSSSSIARAWAATTTGIAQARISATVTAVRMKVPSSFRSRAIRRPDPQRQPYVHCGRSRFEKCTRQNWLSLSVVVKSSTTRPRRPCGPSTGRARSAGTRAG